MKRILFQGDSITDADRSRESDIILGHGYALMTAGKIACDYPGQFEMLNRGVGGNRVTDLYARIKRDIINLKPDYMSLLIGVNDSWHEYDFGGGNGVSVEKYRTILDMLLCEIKAELPDMKLILMEPFILKCPRIEAYFDVFAEEVYARAAVCRELAKKHDLIFVPLQDKLNELAAQSSNSYVLMDGVHPTYAGHEIISRELYNVYRTIL